MLQQLISHSPDLAKLNSEGYILEVDGGQHLLVHQIPYLNSSAEIKYGSLIAILTLSSPNRAGLPPDHTIFFSGEKPHNADGTEMSAIILNNDIKRLTNDITVTHQFSSRPTTGNYTDYYEKVRTYSEILSSQASLVDANITATPNKSKVS